MKRLSLFLLVFLLISLSSFSQNAEKDSIKKCFETYKKSLLKNDGEHAYACLDKKTRKYYDELLEKTKKEDSIHVAKESFVDKLTILTLRHRVPKDEILKMDGKKLFVFSIDNDFVDRGSVTSSDLGEINIRGNSARAQMMTRGLPTMFYYHFYKQKREWLLNLESLRATSNYTLKRLVEDCGRSDNEYIFYSLLKITGRTPDVNIWNPLIK